MLVFSRRQGESVVIGNGIRVSVVAISGQRVRLAFEAPDSVSVDREEVRLRKNKDASHRKDGHDLPGLAMPIDEASVA